MCREHHCGCCSDQFPEDSCACVECYHGDEFLQDSGDPGLAGKQNNKPAKDKSFPAAKTDGTVKTAADSCRPGGCCDSADTCQSTEQKTSDVSNDEALDSSQDSTCKSKCCSAKDGMENVAPNSCGSRQPCVEEETQCAQPKKTSCCDKKANAKSCCDNGGVSQEEQKNKSCCSQPCDDAPDSRKDVPCKTKCCSGKDEVKEDNTAPKSCCAQPGMKELSQHQQPEKKPCCGEQPQCERTLDPSPCGGDGAGMSGASDMALSRETSPDCCGVPSVDEGCSCCPSTDGDSGRPSSIPEISTVCSCCEAESARLECDSDVTCRSRNTQPAQADNMARGNTCCESKSCKAPDVVFTPPEDACCEDDTCKDLSEDFFQRNKSHSRISMTDCSGFYPTTPPPSPRNNTAVEDSGEKKPLLRQNTTKLRVQNICCAMETKLVQDSLEPLEGVMSVAVNVIGRVVHVRHDPEVTSATELVDTLNRNHLGASIMESGAHNHDDAKDGLPRSLTSFGVYLLIQTLLILIAVVAFFSNTTWSKCVAIAEMIFGIYPVLKKAFVSVKTCTVDINILMLIAIAGTVAIQEWLEGAAVVYVFSLAEALQEFCMYKVQRTISGLMLKAPQVAILVKTGECVPVEKVTIGMVIAVRPGELIPLDGVVVNGRAAVDESSISGESVPVEKTVRSKVFSGTVNQNGYLEVETTSDSNSSTVSKVAQLVQEAQTGSSRTEEYINRFAKYYTPSVVIAAALVVAVPAVLGAAGVGTYLQDIREWGQKALVLLVIACPCALVMSTPIAVVCGITSAARKGALIKGGVHLETLAQMQVLAFDKTGTLTEGKFQVVDIECSFGTHERATLRLAAALESKSSHPLAAAIVNEFAGCVAEMVKSESAGLPDVTRFELHEGQGISGVVDGHLVQVGNHEFVHRVGETLSKSMQEKFALWSHESKTVVFVCVNRRLSMMIALADTIRPNCLLTLGWLRELGVQTAMITGDNSRTALAVKEKLGLDECIAEMKPHEKLAWIKRRQAGEELVEGETLDNLAHDNLARDDQAREDHARFRRFRQSCCSCGRYNVLSRDNAKSIVGMVGDGINDGPALAAANIGIAMGAGGTALAVEAADVALMSNNLAKIPELVGLGLFCRRVVAENITFSVVLKLAIVIAALAGKATLWMAVMADVLGLLFVILNGLRPLWWKVAKKDQAKNVDVQLGFAKNARPIYHYETYV